MTPAVLIFSRASKNEILERTLDTMGTKSNRARRASARPSSLSAMSLGRALLLCASATTALNAYRPVTVRSNRATPRESAKPTRRSRRPIDQIAPYPRVGLYYRDGNEDQSAEMRSSSVAAVEEAISQSQRSAAVEASATPQSVTSPRCSGYFTLFSITIPNIVRLPPTANEVDERQAELDEYVKFAAERYSRLHAGESREKSGVNQGGRERRPRSILDLSLPKRMFFSFLAVQTSSVKPVVEGGHPQEEDPLQVLGLSGLASERLKQRLHLKRDLDFPSVDAAYQMLSQRMMATTASTPAEPSEWLVPVPSPSSPDPLRTATEGGRTTSYVSASPLSQLQLLISTLKSFAAALAETTAILWRFAVRVVREVLDKGGFRHSLRMMSVASVALVLMIKPIMQSSMSQKR